MKKLINRKTIQYIKQGYVLYGENGLKINIDEFDDQYWYSNSIKSKYRSLYEKINPKPINKNPEFPQFYNEELDKYNKTFEENYQKFFNDNFIKYNDGYYYKKTSNKGKEILFAQGLKPTEYPNYFRDSQGQLYKRNTSTYASNQPGFFKVSEDIKYGDRVILKAVEPPAAQKDSSSNSSKFANFGKYHNDQNVGYGDYDGKKIAVRYNKNSKTWTYNPVNDNNNTWLSPDNALTDFLNKKYPEVITGQSKPAGNSENGTTDTATGGTDTTTGTTDTATGGSDTGAATDNTTAQEGPTPTEFTAASQKTDRRDIVPSVIQSTMSPQMTPATTTLLPKVTPVARPSNMPLMNRGDVRYTISDITGSSPYFSSDIELVNGLAGAPDNNMFKQALMNRLGMDKWDSSTALNRLNFLGIKGSIGGSDRRRIRNLINNGTTVAGKIRK